MDNVIDFPIELIDGQTFESFLLSPTNENTGILATSEKDENKIVLRLYLAEKLPNKDNFETRIELAAFSFENKKQLTKFIDKLPEISGVDMLILLNPY